MPMQHKLVLSTDCTPVFLFQARLKFFNFQIAGARTPRIYLATPTTAADKTAFPFPIMQEGMIAGWDMLLQFAVNTEFNVLR